MVWSLHEGGDYSVCYGHCMREETAVCAMVTA